MASFLTTLGKYSTAQLLLPPLVLATGFGGANYAYKKYKQYLERRTKKHLDAHAQRKLAQHNSFVDMMRKRHLKPYYRYEDRDKQLKEQQLADQVRRAEARRRATSEAATAKQYDQIRDIRARERAQSEDYMNKLRERDQIRRREAQQRERASWSPTNWFSGDKKGKRKRRPEDDAAPSSPLDYGSSGLPFNRPPHGHNHNNHMGNSSSRKHHNGGRRR